MVHSNHQPHLRSHLTRLQEHLRSRSFVPSFLTGGQTCAGWRKTSLTIGQTIRHLCSEGTHPSSGLQEEPATCCPPCQSFGSAKKTHGPASQSPPERRFELRPEMLLKDSSLWSSNDDLFLNFVMASSAFFDQLGSYKKLGTSY